jgi:RND family efflux transporter MFP subunit
MSIRNLFKSAKFILLLSLLLLLTGCFQSEPEETAERALSVEVLSVSRGDLEILTTLTGQVYPIEEVQLTPRMPGTAAQVHVSKGSRVTAGQVVVTLDQRDTQNSIRQAEASLSSAQAGLGIAQAGLGSAQAGLETALAGQAASGEQYAQAVRELERMQILYDQGAVTGQQLEQAEMSASETILSSSQSQVNQAHAQVNQASAQVNQARAQVNQAQVSVETARSSLADTTIRSPINGVVTEVNVKTGEIISGQMPAVTVSQLDPVIIRTNVSEYLINHFSVNQRVTVRVPSALDVPLQGTVNMIASVPAAGTMTYPMEIRMGNQQSLIKVGMFAEVELTTETRRNVLLLPSEAVVIREGRTVVFLADDDRAVMQEVTIGIDNGESVEVLTGLQVGQRIIYRGQDFLEDGSLIHINGDGSGLS